ncbi:MAG: hypothetical protein JNL99_01925 [Zoogloea sp.]|nr:hypothetical protein [Zoogloea sp.]
MADLSKLTVAGRQAVDACNTAPLLVRSYLAPLRDFVAEVVTALHDLNAQAAGGNAGGDQQKEP